MIVRIFLTVIVSFSSVLTVLAASPEETGPRTVLFPLLGFFSGVFTRWFVNASLFAYLIMCLVAFAVTAAAQMLELLLTGNALLPMLRTAIIQTLWSMPMAAALYFPCRAIGRKKI